MKLPEKNTSEIELSLKTPLLRLKRLSAEELSNYESKRVKSSDVEDRRCQICRQWLDRVLPYEGLPPSSGSLLEEEEAVRDSSLRIDLGDELLPQFKITDFSFYDEENHLVALDSGLIEDNKNVFLSGFLKPITCDDSSPGGSPVRNVGPLRQWWNGGFDGGSRNVIGVSSDLGEYYLLSPAAGFTPLWNDLREKSFLSKVVIEFLESARDSGSVKVFDDLIGRLSEVDSDEGISLNLEVLLKHSVFVLEQILSYDKALDKDELEELSLYPQLLSKCMVDLIKFSGVTSLKGLPSSSALFASSKQRALKKNAGSKATTTPLVNRAFEKIFKEQMSDVSTLNGSPHGSPFTPSGVPFNSSLRSRKNSRGRDSVVEDESKEEISFTDASNVKLHNLLKSSGNIRIFQSALIRGQEIKSGDYVCIRLSDPSAPPCVGYIAYFFIGVNEEEEEENDEDAFPMSHVIWFTYAKDTVLGDVHEEEELFLLRECEDIPASAIESKTSVKWMNHEEPPTERTMEDFFYRFIYCEKLCRYETCSQDVKDFCILDDCQMCSHSSSMDSNAPVLLSPTKFLIGKELYTINDAVYLSPLAHSFNYSYSEHIRSERSHKKQVSPSTASGKKFPEKYRKPKVPSSFNHKTLEPFVIGVILRMQRKDPSDIVLRIRLLYRPENTHLLKCSPETALLGDFNLLYWSETVKEVDASLVRGRVVLRSKESLHGSVEEWTREGEDRFYYSEAYDPNAEKVTTLPHEEIHHKGSSLDHGAYPSVKRPLRTLDVFAGCGGLSHGLHEAGISESVWAIESDLSAASAYKENNADCTVFTEDVNKFLKDILEGKTHDGKGQKLPQKGDVELLVGGPPCQGFSSLNRFHENESSSLKNSLIASYLAMCDHYRPKYFILENVRNFVSYNNSFVLKMTLSSLVRMGYQATFGVLQAGNFGVAQYRRRTILLAAAPGVRLPQYPKALHTFDSNSLSVQIDSKLYLARTTEDAAPYRTLSVRDAISDLEPSEITELDRPQSYTHDPQNAFQRLMRRNASYLIDHATKSMSPLNEARMSLIPPVPGADWRDLPNIKMELSDGSMADILMYHYKSHKTQGSQKRGVCRCAESPGSKCDPLDRQANTLIPWCLPHTADRHRNWSGLFGRLEWDSYFQTTVTNPEPMGKQGRVLHPEKPRILSVRECARSQGFPDHYKFHGKTTDRYRQIGNAVPPPLGYALGIEIRKALAHIP